MPSCTSLTQKRIFVIRFSGIEAAFEMVWKKKTLSEGSMPIKATLFVLLMAMFWGGNVVAIKIGLRGVGPFAAAGIRFGMALPLIALWAVIKRIPLIPRSHEILPLVAIGLIFTLQISILNWGTRLTLAGRATVIFHTYPVFVAFLAHFMVAGDRLNWRKSIGVIGAFTGIVVVFWERLSLDVSGGLAGDLLCLGSGFLLSLLTVLIKRFVQQIESPRLLVWEMIVAVPLFFLLHFLFEHGRGYSFPLPVVAAFLYQGVVIGCFCFLGWIAVIKRYPPSCVSVLFFTAPLWGLAISYLLLGERITAGLGVGTGLVALGIFLVNRG